jgi:membrane protein YdbS with pleckstrin-like domain
MAIELIPLDPLERGYLSVLRIRSVIVWLTLSAIAAAADASLHGRFGIPFGLLGGIAFGWGVITVVFLVPGRWRRWGYAFTDRELHVANGWLTKRHTVVPVSRVQHIDVSQGPLERSAGVATLSLHTAGTEQNLVILPGTKRERAEEIRDVIRSRISDAPW